MASLVNEFRERGRPARVVSIEDELAKLFARDARAPSDGFRERGSFKQVLEQDPNYIQDLWRGAADASRRKADALLTRGEDVLLTFHAVYYADKFGDFYSCVDVALLRQCPKPRTFLTFIDDIGDVNTRLRKEGGVFSHRPQTGVESASEAIRDLMTILEWRNAELVATRLLGTALGKPPLVIAIKHPVVSVVRLLLDDGIPTYVSHPISEARRHFVRHREWPVPFVEELQHFTDALADPGDVPSVRPIPIAPTTIDELRIETLSLPGTNEELLIPRLLPRWTMPRGTLLWSNPTPATDNWLDPCEYFRDHLRRLEASESDSATLEQLRITSGLLRALRDRIRNQVNARDHLLVGQHRAMAVYRPYYAWRISGGVSAEISHHSRRRGREAMAFVHRRDDDPRRTAGIIAELGAKLFSWVRPPNPVGSGEVERVLRDGLLEHLPAAFTADAIRTTVKEILHTSGIGYEGPKRQDAEARVLDSTTSHAIEQLARGHWESIALAARQPDPARRAGQWINGEPDTPPERFAEQVIRHFSRAAKTRRRRSSTPSRARKA